jgi:hypothetical protein
MLLPYDILMSQLVEMSVNNDTLSNLNNLGTKLKKIQIKGQIKKILLYNGKN